MLQSRYMIACDSILSAGDLYMLACLMIQGFVLQKKLAGWLPPSWPLPWPLKSQPSMPAGEQKPRVCKKIMKRPAAART